MKAKLLILITCLLTAQQDHINFRVPGEVYAMKQPKDLDCWITETTMMLYWKVGQELEIDTVASKLGEPWHSLYLTNGGLHFDQQDQYINLIGLRSEPPANYILEAYLDMMKSYGPLWITTGNGFSSHARLLIGIEGDGSYEQTEFIFIDPIKGKEVHQNALKFMHEFEKEAFVANEDVFEIYRLQFHHF